MNGTSMRVKCGADGSEVVIGFLTECSLSLNRDTREITNKDSGGDRKLLPTLRSGSVSFSAIHDESDTATQTIKDLFTLFDADAITHVLFTTGVVGEFEFEADAVITSLEMSAPMEDSVTISGTFELSGEITYTAVA
jgi:TP901-1 family phage major tail protein